MFFVQSTHSRFIATWATEVRRLCGGRWQDAPQGRIPAFEQGEVAYRVCGTTGRQDQTKKMIVSTSKMGTSTRLAITKYPRNPGIRIPRLEAMERIIKFGALPR